MMFRPVILAVAASLFAAPALAAPVWVGGFLVTALTGADCAIKVNIQVGDLYTVILHPKLSGDATVSTDVIQIIRETQRAIRLVPKAPAITFAMPNGNYSGTSWSARAVIKTGDASYRNLVVSPTPAPGQQLVNMSGTFKRFDGFACEVTFAAGLTLKP